MPPPERETAPGEGGGSDTQMTGQVKADGTGADVASERIHEFAEAVRMMAPSCSCVLVVTRVRVGRDVHVLSASHAPECPAAALDAIVGIEGRP